MAFTQSQLVDLLFKKTINFVSNTKPAGVPAANEFYNEGFSSFPLVQTSQIWLQSDQIPTTAATVSGITQLVKVQLTPVTGAVSSGVTYSFYDASGTLIDIIPPSINSTYALKLFKGDGTTELSTLNNGGYGDMFFDTSSSVLTFFTPSAISLSGNPWVQAWKYVGKKGPIPNLQGITYSSGTMSLVIGSGLTFSGGSLVATTQNPNVGNGLTSQGTTFSVLLQGNSGLTVSNLGLSINPNAIGTGLTFTSGVLSTVISSVIVGAGDGLTSSGNTFSIQLQSNSGLTISSSGIAVNPSIAGSGLLYNNGVLSASGVSFNIGNGLTSVSGTLSVIVDNASSLTFSSGNLSISGRIAGTSLTFSNGILNVSLPYGVNSAPTNSIAFYSTSGTISGTFSVSNIFLQGGNSFGSTALFGTNDNNNLQLETNGSVKMQIGTSGNVTIGTTVESNGYQLRVVGSVSVGGYLVMTQSSSTNPAITIGSVFGLTAQSQRVFIGVSDNTTHGSNTGFVSFGSSFIGTNPNIQSDGTTLYILNPNSTPNIAVYRTPTASATIMGAGIRQFSSDVFRFTFDQSQGQLTATQGTQTIINGFYNVNSDSVFGPTSGTARFMVYGANGNINQTGSASGVVSLISDNSLTIGTNSLAYYRAFEATKSGGYGFYQTSTSTKNFFGGRSSFGSTTDDGTSIVQVYGTISTTGLKITNPKSSSAATYSYLIWNGTTNNVELSEVISGTPIMMYSTTHSFSGSVTQTFTHSLSSTDFIIQMYDTSSGDEVMAQYSNRTYSTIDITVFESVTAKIVIIG